jgi:alpha-1,6-mannosyltransferase
MAFKTLHLTNYWHERSGGVATFYRHLMDAANHRQHPMIMVVPGAQDEIQEVGAYCRIYKISAPSAPLNPEYRALYPREFLLPSSRIQQILARERPDLVEICDKYSLVHLGALLRHRLAGGVDSRPVVVGLTCERMDENLATYITRAAWGQALSRLYMRHVYFTAFDHHIAVSEHTAAELKRIANGHLISRGVWIRPMGVDAKHFSPSKRCPQYRRQLNERCKASPNDILLLYVGRLAPEKNVELLIAIMAELQSSGRNFRLVCGGDGISRAALERSAHARVPGKVIFLGHQLDRDELARLYANCDVFVHPNPAEPFGIAPLEAMASGLPLVAPDRGGVTSYATHHNAYLAPPTPEAFATAILTVCRAHSTTTQKIQEARKTAETFAWPKVTDSYLRLYEDLHRVRSTTSAADLSPAFVSSKTDLLRTTCLSFASEFAQASFLLYARTHQLLDNIRSAKRTLYQPEVEDIRTP